MIVVNPDMRYDAQSILECDIVKKKIKELNFSLKDSYVKTKALLMRTIKLPKNMSEINNNLPKRYLEKTLREEEMMENDEYETVKQTFYKSIMNSEKNKEKNQIQNNNNNNNKNNNNNNKLKVIILVIIFIKVIIVISVIIVIIFIIVISVIIVIIFKIVISVIIVIIFKIVILVIIAIKIPIIIDIIII